MKEYFEKFKSPLERSPAYHLHEILLALIAYMPASVQTLCISALTVSGQIRAINPTLMSLENASTFFLVGQSKFYLSNKASNSPGRRNAGSSASRLLTTMST